MKKVLLLTLCFSFIIGAVFADTMNPGNEKKPVYPHFAKRITAPSREEIPTYTMVTPPVTIMDNYYDYMIGAYNHLPMQVIPDEAGGGYFMTFHGKSSAASTRRVYWVYVSGDGSNVQSNEITNNDNNEGYPTIGVDPVSGKPMYAWHANHDDDVDALLEVQFVWDSFLFDVPGTWNTVVAPIDNPLIQIDDPFTGEPSIDNEFIWPTIKIGPSPNADMRRVYIVARNSVSHTGSGDPSENAVFAYADFSTQMLTLGNNLTWNYTTIPELDSWNHDPGMFRRPNHTLAVDDLGNVYYFGHHIANNEDGTGSDEPDMDVFICSNYGEGEWIRYSAPGSYPIENPVMPDGTTYFDDYELFFGFNSSHQNAVIDNLGRIHSLGIWAQSTNENTYYPGFQNVKNIIYDTNSQSFMVQDFYPKKPAGDDVNDHYVPWDIEAPFGEIDEINYDETNGYYPTIETTLPLPHHDWEFHSDSVGSMGFHYNNQKLTEVNEQGMMVAVWQDSEKARLGINWPDDYPEYVAYTTGPEIMIATSKDNGTTWSDPLRLNAVDTPELAGMIPMWVYPADKIKYVGESDNGNPIGRLGFMFYDDNTWGSYVIEAALFPSNDGGTVKYMELDIEFPGTATNDNVTPVVNNILKQNYPNPFNPETTISFDMPKNGKARLDVYNVKGQLVNTLFNGIASLGKNSVVWNGTDTNGNGVTSGLYFYRLSTDSHSETRKMMLMK